ncbi:5096_t:CDS:1 [Ambispora gerdemannii]|uniref:ADP-ribose 1''-phosphate phosphatase n=1 Tax=Ambispora gerdemannii TaxID=144530 RepID=A0A9N9F6D5_9GLOM|nr:5096_t:CDS:1 [Ambispora gerdemannii]
MFHVLYKFFSTKPTVITTNNESNDTDTLNYSTSNNDFPTAPILFQQSPSTLYNNTNKKTCTNFQERQGDLFTDSPPTNALVHCVSQDFNMGGGIAREFRNRFNSIKELKSQRKKVGQVAYLNRDGRYLFYIITKRRVNEYPTCENFMRGLIELRHVCEKFGVKGLCMPRIGTGIDKLSLDFVRESVKHVFDGSDIQITMFFL